jgi:GntR family transcriptional regulator
LEILISRVDSQPIYNQIYSQIKGHILSGRLQEGDVLPSIRALAKDLRISVITTKRAYDELEQEGFIYTVAGKGCFVAKKDTNRLRQENLKKLTELMKKVAALARLCGLTEHEIMEIYHNSTKEE